MGSSLPQSVRYTTPKLEPRCQRVEKSVKAPEDVNNLVKKDENHWKKAKPNNAIKNEIRFSSQPFYWPRYSFIVLKVPSNSNAFTILQPLFCSFTVG